MIPRLPRCGQRLRGRVDLGWSVRLRVTVVASGVVVALLAAASLALVRLVERELVQEAEAVMADSIAEVNEEVAGALEPGDGAFFEYRTDDGVVFLGVVAEGDALVAPVVDPDTREEIGEVVLDPDSGEVVEAYLDERAVPVDALPGEVRARLAEVAEVVRSVPSLQEGGVVVTTAPLKEVRSSLTVLRRALLLVVPALGIALGVAVWWLAGAALRPVGAITGRARRIDARTLTERVPVPRARDEVGELATVVNAMLDRIERGVRRERQFVADASHELRTPLATIRAAVELAEHRSRESTPGVVARDDPRLPDPATPWREASTDVMAEVDRMDALVGDLLVMARLDEGHLGPAATEIDVTGLVGRAVSAAGDERVVLGTAASDGSPGRDRPQKGDGSPGRVRGHEGLLLRLASNLLANARRYADRQVVASVATPDTDGTVAPGWLELRVDDDGPGIPEHERERAFERFARLDASRAGDGFGLGLAIVRGIARQHGGDARVTDSPLGGARVVVSLPAVSPPVVGDHGTGALDAHPPNEPPGISSRRA